MIPRWRPYRALTIAILRTSLRNPVASFGFFAVLMLMLAGVKYLEVARFQGPSVALASQASTPASRQLVDAIRGTPGFTVQEVAADEARRSVGEDRADVAVIIPPGFGTSGSDGRVLPQSVTVVSRAGGLGEQAAGLIAAAVDRVDRQAQGAPQALTVTHEVQNAGLGVVDLFLPGLLGFNVVQTGLLAAAGMFAGYRTAGVLRRVQATGIAPANLVLAHASASLLLGASQIGLMVIAAALLFTVHFDLAAMFLVSLLGYLVFLAAGFAISGWIRDPQRAPAVATGVGMPMILLGLLPPQVVSGTAAAVLGVLPISLVTHALRQLVEGRPWAAVSGDLLGLTAWAAAMLVAASRAFRWDDR